MYYRIGNPQLFSALGRLLKSVMDIRSLYIAVNCSLLMMMMMAITLIYLALLYRISNNRQNET